MTRMKAALAVLLLVAVAALPSVTLAQNPKLRLGWQTGSFNFVTMVAKERGFFQQSGLDVEYLPFPFGAAMGPALAAKELDLGWIFAFPVTTMYAGGLQAEVILFDHAPKAYERLVAKPQYKTVNDLKGKSVGVSFGTSSHFFLLKALTRANVAPADVKFVNLQPAAMAPAFTTGQIDAAFTWDPGAANLNKAGGIDLATTGSLGEMAPGMWYGRSEYIRQNPEAIQRFLKGWEMALQFMLSNTREAVSYEAKRLNMSPDDALVFLKAMDTEYPTFEQQQGLPWIGRPGQQNQTRLVIAAQEYAKFLKEQGRIKELPSDWSRVVNPEPLDTYLKTKKR